MIKNATGHLTKIDRSQKLFIDILLEHAELSPDKRAFTYLSSSGDISINYSQLVQRIKNLAGILQKMNLKGERALLLYPPGLDYIIGYFACLFAGVIAVPVYPPDPTRLRKTLPRIQSIAKDSIAKVALSTEQKLSEMEQLSQVHQVNTNLEKDNGQASDNHFEFDYLYNLNWIATDSTLINPEIKWKYPELNSDSIAYLQYTSGSTGDPKGVMISHENIVHNTNMIFNSFGLGGTEFEGVIWLPIYHDMGLIGGIMEPIYSGFHCTLLSPVDFLKRPLKWLQIISDHKERPIVSGGPNFAYELCLRASNPQKREALDLTNWEVAFSGAEPVSAKTILEFSKAFKISGFKKRAFYPCYGLAEATLIVSGGDKNEEPITFVVDKTSLKNNKVIEKKLGDDDSKIFVSSGREILDGTIIIVNPNKKSKCDSGEIGEVWTFSKSNAKGYWKKPIYSDEIFNAFTSDTNEGPFLRTGDLGFIINGELYITGRVKDLIIIRGSNHYPQDIEATVDNSSKLLRPGSSAVFSVEQDNEENLVIVAEARAKKDIDWSLVCEDIKKEVLEYHSILASHIVLIKPKTIFKTSSGKIQRSATKKAFLRNSLEIIYHWSNNNNGNENYLFDVSKNKINNHPTKNNIVTNIPKEKIVDLFVEKISEELKLPINKIDKNVPFSNFGLDSAKSVQLIGQLEDLIGQTLEPTLMWNYPTINKFADYLTKSETENQSEFKNKTINTQNNLDVSEIEKLSDEEAEALLLRKLKSDDLGI